MRLMLFFDGRVSHAGRHAVEGMIIARYMMFNQVYYHHTRVILDRHLQRALESMLPGGKFPPPTPDQIADFLAWDDWRVLGVLAAGGGGDHGRRLRERDFFRWVWETPEFRSDEDEEQLQTVISRLGNLLAEKIDAAEVVVQGRAVGTSGSYDRRQAAASLPVLNDCRSDETQQRHSSLCTNRRSR